MREDILALRVTIKKTTEKGKSTYIGFVHLGKAFDNVNWQKIFKVLKYGRTKDRDRKVVYNLCKEKTAVIEIEEERREVNIRKRVRQVCILSPLIFNLHITDAMNIVKDRIDFGINREGQKTKMLRFVDDIKVLVSSKEKLEIALNEIETVLIKRFRIKINKCKTKVLMCRGRENKTRTRVQIDGEKLKKVKDFMYLGIKIN